MDLSLIKNLKNKKGKRNIVHTNLKSSPKFLQCEAEEIKLLMMMSSNSNIYSKLPVMLSFGWDIAHQCTERNDNLIVQRMNTLHAGKIKRKNIPWPQEYSRVRWAWNYSKPLRHKQHREGGAWSYWLQQCRRLHFCSNSSHPPGWKTLRCRNQVHHHNYGQEWSPAWVQRKVGGVWQEICSHLVAECPYILHFVAKLLHIWGNGSTAKMNKVWVREVFTLQLLFQADSVRLRVSRMDIFLLFHHSIFLRNFQSWSEHFWLDQSVQWTFLMDCQWTNNKPATEMTRTDGIPMDIANNESPMNCKQAGSLLVLLMKNNMNNN